MLKTMPVHLLHPSRAQDRTISQKTSRAARSAEITVTTAEDTAVSASSVRVTRTVSARAAKRARKATASPERRTKAARTGLREDPS